MSRRPLAFQLTLLVIATALPLMLAALLMYDRLVASQRENIRQSLLVSAETLASLVENEIDTHAAIAATLAQSRSLLRGDLADFRLQAIEALRFVPGAWLVVSTPDGQIVVNTLVPPGSALPKRAAPDVMMRAFSERRRQVGDLVFGPIGQKWTAFVEVPVFQDGAPLYSIAITLSPERFLGLMTKQFDHGEVVGVIDRNKNFVARIPDHETRIGKPASEGWRASIAQSPEGWSESKTLEGEASLTAYAPTRDGWTAGVALLESQISRPLDAILWWSTLVAGALILLSLFLAVAIGRRANQGMTVLAETAHAVGEGRPVAAPSMPFAEATTIAAALAGASAELARRGEVIARNQSELETTVAERTGELVAEIARRERSESTLRQTQKMESIGQLTGGIAHDFNNMLTIIMGNLEIIQRRLKSLDNAAILNRPVEAALYGARNAAKLTHRLLAFGRQQPLAPSSVNLNTLVADLADFLERTVGEHIEVETVSAAGQWTAFADANQLENCLINLVVNARDAMPGGGKLTIETGNAFLDDAYVARFGDLAVGQYAMLSVSDTGIGMDAQTLEKVFEPFYTTKESGKGTGLGLAMVHGFVRQSGGHVRLYSEVGQGTTVKIYLPRYIDQASLTASPRTEGPGLPLAGGARAGETILLVEDDSGVREYAIGALEDLGYQVLAASDGAEALGLLGDTTRVDLLFTDVVLGGAMTGKELADRILGLRPSLPVLFTTGYTRNAIVHQGRLDAGVNLLNKPYTLRDLADKVRRVIDQAATRSPTTAA